MIQADSFQALPPLTRGSALSMTPSYYTVTATAPATYTTASNLVTT